jgi:aspartate kinase
MFKALADHDINVEMVNTSEIKVSVVVAGGQTQRALTALQNAFGIES